MRRPLPYLHRFGLAQSPSPLPVLVTCLVCVLFGPGIRPSLAQQKNQVHPIFATTYSAVARSQIKQTNASGFGGGTPYLETCTTGGFLVGFDVGVGKFINQDTVYALRPIYLTHQGQVYIRKHGLFQDERDANNQLHKSRVDKTVRLRAKPGYAVGAITIRTGLNIGGFSLTYMRIAGGTLDPRYSYTSEWVGNQSGGSETVITSQGTPIVGLHGTEDDQVVRSIGIIHLDPELYSLKFSSRLIQGPEAGRNTPVVAKKPVDQPPIKKTAPPVPQPKIEPKQPVVVAPEIPNEEEEHKEKAEPALAQEEEEKQDQADQEQMGDVVAVAEYEADEKAASGNSLFWVPYVVFGIFTIPAVVLLVWYSRKKSKPEAEFPPPLPKVPPPLPEEEEDIPMVQPASGISEKPLSPLPPPLPNFIHEQPVYFSARAVFAWKASHHFRVYILQEELLFIKDPVVEEQLNNSFVMGGLLGWLIFKAVSEMRKPHLAKKARELDEASTDKLIWMSENQSPNFRVRIEDLHDLILEPPGVWHGFLHTRRGVMALFRFSHPKQGKYTLEIAKPEDLLTFLEKLDPVLGHRLDNHFPHYQRPKFAGNF